MGIERRINRPWRSVHRTTVREGDDAPAKFLLPNNRGPSGAQKWQTGRNALIRILADAEKANARILPIGNAWSLSTAITPTNADDWLVDISNLNAAIATSMAAKHLLSGKKNPDLATFQAGILVADAHQVLGARGRSLRTTGASSGQTLAGAISTGTHGCAVSIGSMQDTVVGLHLVGAGGRSAWVQPASNPVTSPAWAAHLGAEDIHDDDLFHAALVGFGGFGVIHAYLLQTEPLTLFRKHRTTWDIDEVLEGLGRSGQTLTLNPELIAEDPSMLESFEMILDPNQVEPDGKALKGPVAVQTVFRLGDAPPTYPRPPTKQVYPGLNDDILHRIASLANKVPGVLSNKFIRSTTKREFAERFGDLPFPYTGVLSELYPLVDPPAGGVSIELGVDAKQSSKAIIAVLHALHAKRHGAIMGIMGIRFVRQSKATLAFTRFPVTCTIEMPAVPGKRTEKHFPAMCQALVDANIPFTSHWGQWADYSTFALAASFPKARIDAWKKARRQWLGAEKLRRFGGRILSDAGL